MDRFRDNSTCALFEWEGERCGTTGVSRAGSETISGRTGVLYLESKKDLLSFTGVTGVAGPLLSTDEVSLAALLRKLLSMVEKPESIPELSEAVDDPETVLMSGAVKAWTLVVEINSVGREMRLRLIVPGVYLTLVPRWIEERSILRLVRLVKARARDIVEDDMAGKGS